MVKSIRVAVGLATAAVLAAIATVALGRAVFERRIGRGVDELLAASRSNEPVVISEADFAGLPDPVRRWLHWAGVSGTRRPAVVRLRQEGRFRTGDLGPDRGWMPFTAEEISTTDPPGFLWSTQMRLGGVLPIVGRDRYAGGRGSIEMRLLGLVPVANAAGERLDQGALLRYLNETIWFPGAVLAPSIRCAAGDETSARATISDGGVTASAIFVFDG